MARRDFSAVYVMALVISLVAACDTDDADANRADGSGRDTGIDLRNDASNDAGSIDVGTPDRPISDAADGGISDMADAASDGDSRDLGGEAPASGAEGVCIETPTPRGAGRNVITVNVVLTYAGKPVMFGEPFPLKVGSLIMTTFRFFTSDFALTRSSGEVIPVDLVAANGAPAPYNVHLVNPEEPSGMTFQIAAPSGDYAGAKFLFGLNDDCDHRDPGNSLPPLDHTSQLSWPPPYGFLFLRYSGIIGDTTIDDGTPTQIDMGGFPGGLFAPQVTAPGAFTVSGEGQRIELRMAIDEVFRASQMPADPFPAEQVTPPGISFNAGESLRQNAAKVAIFSLTSR